MSVVEIQITKLSWVILWEGGDNCSIVVEGSADTTNPRLSRMVA